jgi:hypothetical protein
MRKVILALLLLIISTTGAKGASREEFERLVIKIKNGEEEPYRYLKYIENVGYKRLDSYFDYADLETKVYFFFAEQIVVTKVELKSFDASLETQLSEAYYRDAYDEAGIFPGVPMAILYFLKGGKFVKIIESSDERSEEIRYFDTSWEIPIKRNTFTSYQGGKVAVIYERSGDIHRYWLIDTGIESPLL